MIGRGLRLASFASLLALMIAPVASSAPSAGRGPTDLCKGSAEALLSAATTFRDDSRALLRSGDVYLEEARSAAAHGKSYLKSANAYARAPFATPPRWQAARRELRFSARAEQAGKLAIIAKGTYSLRKLTAKSARSAYEDASRLAKQASGPGGPCRKISGKRYAGILAKFLVPGYVRAVKALKSFAEAKSTHKRADTSSRKAKSRFVRAARTAGTARRDELGAAPRIYQPVLVTSKGDPFAPIPFDAVFRFRKLGEGSDWDVPYTCVDPPCDRRATIEDLAASAGAGLRLQYPANELISPQYQMMAEAVGRNPHKAARLYYFRTVGPAGTIAIEYWAFYSFNFQPEGPGEVNRHEGDWEQLSIFLARSTLKPKAVALFSHGEAKLINWSGAGLNFTKRTHVRGYPAIGSHATYGGCGLHINAPANDHSCVGGERVFGGKTPLINLRRQPWACWQGEAGEGGGPQMPLRQQGSTYKDQPLYPQGDAVCG